MFVRNNQSLTPMIWARATDGWDLSFRSYVNCAGLPCVAASDPVMPVPDPGVPEPMTTLLFGTGVAAIVARRYTKAQ